MAERHLAPCSDVGIFIETIRTARKQYYFAFRMNVQSARNWSDHHQNKCMTFTCDVSILDDARKQFSTTGICIEIDAVERRCLRSKSNGNIVVLNEHFNARFVAGGRIWENWFQNIPNSWRSSKFRWN